jgi:agmatine deiminase
LVPTFNDTNDSKALEIIRGLFPDRTVTGINCTDLIYGGGAIHCITQQEPL